MSVPLHNVKVTKYIIKSGYAKVVPVKLYILKEKKE